MANTWNNRCILDFGSLFTTVVDFILHFILTSLCNRLICHTLIFLPTSLHQLLYRLSRDNLKIFNYQIFPITLNSFLIFLYRVLEAT